MYGFPPYTHLRTGFPLAGRELSPHPRPVGGTFREDPDFSGKPLGAAFSCCVLQINEHIQVSCLKRFLKKRHGRRFPEEEQVQRYYRIREERYDTEELPPVTDEHAVRRKMWENVRTAIGRKGRTVPLWKKTATVAASLVLALGAFWLAYRYNPRYESLLSGKAPAENIAVTTGTGDIRQVQLPDGSRIWLNSHSRLDYPADFGKAGTREVFLDGEAFFEVARDQSKPFIVRSGKLSTRVLGTSFNVSAYPDDPGASVTVATGQVGVLKNDSEDNSSLLLLSANQQAVLHSPEQPLRHIVNGIDAQSYAAWREGRLVFRNSTLHDAVHILKRKYGISLEYPAHLADCTVYFEFRDEPAEEVVRILAGILGARLTGSGNNTFRLEGPPCGQTPQQ